MMHIVPCEKGCVQKMVAYQVAEHLLQTHAHRCMLVKVVAD